MSVYQYGSSGPSLTPPTSAPISPPTPAPVKPDVIDLGCYMDNPSGRTMTLTFTDSAMTTEVMVLSGRIMVSCR